MISKGRLVLTKEVCFINQKAALTFTPTFSFAPITQVVCFALEINGNVASAQITINLNDKLPNYVSNTFILC
jgi:hypothetical protein